MKSNSSLFLLSAICLIALATTADAADLRSARDDISRLRYKEAEQQLVQVARSSNGQEQQEALFLLAGLKNSVPEAQIIYEEVIQLDPGNEWGKKSQIELAKIQYAIGDYGQAMGILRESSACRHSEEACYFEGLSAIMLKRYGDAREPLSRVRRGSYQPWAYLALAEIDMETQESDEACRKYRSMARSGLSPTAMYRYGECLEKEGDGEEATAIFASIVREFRDTPEAVVAAQKLDALSKPQKPILEPMDAPEGEALRRGFTVQFGSFHDRTNAIKLMSELKGAVPGIRIDSDLVNYREVHRVRFGYFATRSEARKMADELERQIDEPVSIMTLP